MNEDARLQRYAELTVHTGANVAPDQLVVIQSAVANAPLVRALAIEAYKAGARFVDARYTDLYLTRAHVQYGPEETLGWSGPWDMSVIETLDREHGSFIQVHEGNPHDLLGDLDQGLAARAGLTEARRLWVQVVGKRTVNWTIVSMPGEDWARRVFGEPDTERLWEEVARAVRLDEPDPVKAWNDHLDRLADTASWLNSLELDSLHLVGPGTDLTVGLLPSSRFIGGRFQTTWGRRHTPNLPTEEVFTSPDPERTEGTVRSTRPLHLLGGVVVEGLELTFKGGRIVDVRASKGVDAMRGEVDSDAGAARLGEVALVDGSSRVGQSGLVFDNTLFDENAASHIAYGEGFGFAAAGDESAVNRSRVHTDLMVGSPEIEVIGKTRIGKEVVIIRDNRFWFD